MIEARCAKTISCLGPRHRLVVTIVTTRALPPTAPKSHRLQDMDIVVDRQYWPQLQRGLEALGDSCSGQTDPSLSWLHGSGCRVFRWKALPLRSGPVGGNCHECHVCELSSLSQTRRRKKSPEFAPIGRALPPPSSAGIKLGRYLTVTLRFPLSKLPGKKVIGSAGPQTSIWMPVSQ